jgi:hypothetical protein
MVTMELLWTPSSNGSRRIGGINNLLNAREYCHCAMTGKRLAYVCVCFIYIYVGTLAYVCINTFSRLQLNPPSIEITGWETSAH